MEAYADPLKYYEPDPPNTTNPKEVAERLAVNDEEVCNEEDDNDENLDARIDDNDNDTVFNKILRIDKLTNWTTLKKVKDVNLNNIAGMEEREV